MDAKVCSTEEPVDVTLVTTSKAKEGEKITSWRAHSIERVFGERQR